MNVRPVVFAAVAILSGCATPSATLPAKHAIVNDRFRLIEPSVYWTPQMDDITALEAELSRLWVHPDRRVRGRPETPLSNFIVRYYGEIKEGRRVVVGEGQLLETRDAAAFLGDRSGIMMTAFGASRFSVQFDPETKRVIKLEVIHASL